MCVSGVYTLSCSISLLVHYSNLPKQARANHLPPPPPAPPPPPPPSSTTSLETVREGERVVLGSEVELKREQLSSKRPLDLVLQSIRGMIIISLLYDCTSCYLVLHEICGVESLVVNMRQCKSIWLFVGENFSIFRKSFVTSTEHVLTFFLSL